MKKTAILILAATLCVAAFAQTAPETSDLVHRAPPAAAAAGKPVLDTLIKERDEARAQLAAAQQQSQQQQVATEYFKAVAEKNEALLRIVALQQALAEANAEITRLQNELTTAKAPPAPVAPKK